MGKISNLIVAGLASRTTKMLLPAGLLTLFGLFYYLTQLQPFPRFAVGQYYGEFDCSVLRDCKEPVVFRFSVLKAGVELSIFDASWNKQFFDGGFDFDKPLLVKGSESQILRFEGGEKLSWGYTGKVTNILEGKVGKWLIYDSKPRLHKSLTAEAQDKLLEFKFREYEYQQRIISAQSEKASVEAEVLKVKQALEDSEGLRLKAQQRYEEKRDSITRIKAEIADLESRIAKLNASLQVARSVSVAGRLATLARERLKTEYSSMTQGLDAAQIEQDSKLLEMAARAKEALRIKRQIDDLETEVAATKGVIF